MGEGERKSGIVREKEWERERERVGEGDRKSGRWREKEWERERERVG